MEIVNPTRMNLLLKREEVKSASTGVELLRNKRDVLLIEFFSALRSLVVLRDKLNSQAIKAAHSLFFALGLDGKEKLSSHSFIKPKPVSLEVNYRNLLGLKIPEITINQSNSKKETDFIRLDGVSTFINETREDFQDFLHLALKVLPQEIRLKRLGQEIKNTTRKVNSLEKFVMPRLKSQVKLIRETLEEREREDIFRLKRLKRHSAR